jgi:type I restriction enzyme S subunit
MNRDLKPYPEYKDSGVPWLGKVPAHWTLRRTKTALRERVEKGFPDEPLLAATQTKGVVRKDQYENRTVLALKDLHLLKLVRVGDFVISLRSFQGGIEFAHEQGIISPAYTVMYPADPAAHGFLAWLFKSKPYVENLTLYVTGIRQGQNIDYERLSRSALPLPPLSEQTAIVRFLDHVDRKIKKHIRAKQQLIKLLEEEKQAIIHRAVTRGLDPTVRLKPSGVEWLGDVPEHWKVKKLRHLFRYSKSRRAAELTNEYIGRNPGVYAVYSGQTEANGLMGTIDWHEFDFEDPVIFVTTVGARAMSTRLVRGKFSLSQNCALIAPRNGDANSAYFELTLQRLFAYERASISLIMQPSLRFTDLNRFSVPCPPVEEQVKIAEESQGRLSQVDNVASSTRREISLLREYRTRLIADVVTGKLDVREAAANLPEEAEEGEVLDESEAQTEGGEDGDAGEADDAAEETES